MGRGFSQKIEGPVLCGPGLVWQLHLDSRDRTLSVFLPTILSMWAFVMMLMSCGCMMAAVPPGLTSVFQAGRMEVKVKRSFLARICLLEVRGQDMLSRD